MKAKLKALSCLIGGKVYNVEDNFIFDTEKTPTLKSEIEAKLQSGHLVEIVEKKEVKIETKTTQK